MSEQPPGGSQFDLKRAEVEDFFKRADSLMIRANELLSDHYNNNHRLGEKTVQKVCELYANSSSFRGLLEKTFRLEEAPENAVFRIKSEHVTAIMTFIMALMDTKSSLIISNISLKEH